MFNFVINRDYISCTRLSHCIRGTTKNEEYQHYLEIIEILTFQLRGMDSAGVLHYPCFLSLSIQRQLKNRVRLSWWVIPPKLHFADWCRPAEEYLELQMRHLLRKGFSLQTPIFDFPQRWALWNRDIPNVLEKYNSYILVKMFWWRISSIRLLYVSWLKKTNLPLVNIAGTGTT